MKKQLLTIAAGSLFAASALQAANYAYPQLYKDPRIMGMGGANVAVGGLGSSVFHNPAGLSRIPQAYGWEVDILNMTASINQDILDFADDLSDADGSEETSDVLDKYTGKNNHISYNNYSSVSRKFDKIAFSVGALASLDLDMRPHQGFGPEGILEVNGLALAGGIFGLSYDLGGVDVGNYTMNDLSVGGAVKVIRYGAMDMGLSASEIDELSNADDVYDYMDDRGYINEGTDTVVDLGAIYNVTPEMSAGVSVLNIGGISEGVREIPMTVNVGGAYTLSYPDRAFFSRVRFAADYVDLTGGYEDSSYLKRTRMGADLQVLDNWLSTLNLQAGLYQGHMSAGFDVRLSVVRLAYTTYAEELGAYSGQDADRRHMVSFAIGW